MVERAATKQQDPGEAGPAWVWLALVVAAGICAVEALALGGVFPSTFPAAPQPSPVPVLILAPMDVEPAPARSEADELSLFLVRMTPDDVARGLWALADEQGELALDAAQREACGPALQQLAELHRRRGQQRMARRALAERSLRTAGRILEATGGWRP